MHTRDGCAICNYPSRRLALPLRFLHCGSSPSSPLSFSIGGFQSVGFNHALAMLVDLQALILCFRDFY